MLIASLWWLFGPRPEYFNPVLFWVWIVALFALFVETIYSYSLAHYVGRTRAFLMKLLMSAATNIFSFASVYRHTGIESMDGEIISNTHDAVYFSIITWTTVGYGDMVPVYDSRLIAAAQGLLGYVYMATIVGLVMVEVGVRRGEGR